jgi:hypothetical protein
MAVPWDNVPALLDYLKANLPRFPVQAWEVGMFWVGRPAGPQARPETPSRRWRCCWPTECGG